MPLFDPPEIPPAPKPDIAGEIILFSLDQPVPYGARLA